MPDDPRDVVESGYDAIADRYAEVIRAGRGPETYFRAFLARVLIPEGGTVLDVSDVRSELVSPEMPHWLMVARLDRRRSPAMSTVMLWTWKTYEDANASKSIVDRWSGCTTAARMHAD